MQYQYNDLGNLGGTYSFATGINASGHVVGQADLANGFVHAFLKNPGQPMEDLGTLGGYNSLATGINASGQVVGMAETADGSEHAFLKNPGQPMEDLGTLGGPYSYAGGINASGQVVGEATLADGSQHAFLKNPGQPMEDLGTLGGYSLARGINASGQVVGVAQMADGSQHAFLKNPGQPMEDLGTLGGVNSDATGINASGRVVGVAQMADGSQHAFLKNPGQPMEDLGTLGRYSVAAGINASGQVVGVAVMADGSHRGFLYTLAEGMKDLNALLINVPAGDTLKGAEAINDNGQIVVFSNAGRAFLLTPVKACNPPRSVYPDDSKAFGFFEGVIIGKEYEDQTVVNYDIKATEIANLPFVTNKNLQLWFSINLSNNGNIAVKPSNPWAKLGILPPKNFGALPNCEASYEVSFCKPGEVVFELDPGFINNYALSFTLADAILGKFIPPDYDPSNYKNLVDDLLQIESFKNAIDHFHNALLLALNKKEGRALMELTAETKRLNKFGFT